MNAPRDIPLCAHCADAITGPAVIEKTGGEEKKFCCRGCAAAFRIITGAGLGDFYRRREWNRPGADRELFDLQISETKAARFLVAGNDRLLRFAVANVRCAACVWLIERILAAAPGVRDVRGNFARHTFQVEFDPDATTPAGILGRVVRIGYRPVETGTADDNERRRELVRFATAAFFSSQLMVCSLGLYAGFFQGIAEEYRRLLQLLSGIIATPVVLWCALPFFRGAVASLRNLTPGMDLLVATGVGTAYLYSWAAFILGRETWFEAAAMVVTLVLLGRLVEGAGRRRALAGIDRIITLAPAEAARIERGRTKTVAVSELAPGDEILLRSGERLAVDGLLIDPETGMDTSIVSGESAPRRVCRNDEVAAGCVNLGPPVRLRVLRRAEESFIARMGALVEEGLARKAPVQRMADRAAAFFVPVVFAVACAAFLFHFRSGRTEAAVLAAVAVLVVACPCALGLATPLAVAAAMGRAAGRGVLLRSGEAMEKCAAVDTIALDKTGTLTAGTPALLEVVTMDGRSADAALRAAATAAALSTHPAAKAIVKAAEKSGLVPKTAEKGREIPGRGIIAVRKEKKILLGSRHLLAEHGVAVPEPSGEAASELWLAEEGTAVALFRLADPLLPAAGKSVARLTRLGLAVAILSGDREEVVEKIAEETGAKEYLGGLRPEEKTAWIEARGKAGKKVLMAGDGINDAPALAAAYVSASFAAASDIALAASDIVLPAGGIALLPWTVELSRRAMRIVRENLVWAFSYNLIAIPLAAAGLLAPVWAAALMGASSLLVVGNSARLRRDCPRQGKPLKL